MARYHGKNHRVLISSVGSGTASQLLGTTSFDLDASVDTVEVTAGTDTNKQYVQGLADASVSIEGVWDDTETKLFAAAASATPVKVYLYPDHTNAAGKVVSGTFWLSARLAAGVGAAVTYSASLVPASAVTYAL